MQISQKDKHFNLGNYTITSLVDEDCFEIDIARMFPQADIAGLAKLKWLNPLHYDPKRGVVRLGMYSFLVRTQSQNILIDMCVGENKDRPNHKAWHQRTNAGLLVELGVEGLRPEDIDLVFCTHLHADHVGWNTKLVGGRWVPTFPNARYAMAKEELSFWQQAHKVEGAEANHGAFVDSVLPVVESGQVLEVAVSDSLFDGMRFVDLSGHTSGHMGLEITAKDEAVLFCGDAIHSPLQLHYPELSSAFCADPLGASRTRRKMLEEVADRDMLLCPAHFRGKHAVRIKCDRDNFSFRD